MATKAENTTIIAQDVKQNAEVRDRQHRYHCLENVLFLAITMTIMELVGDNDNIAIYVPEFISLKTHREYA